MKILILSFYYPPDLSAGSFRVKALVEALREAMPSGLTIDVVTTMPNRYHSLAGDAPKDESDGCLTIRRIALPGHKSGMADQARSFLTFAREARRLTKGGSWDAVVATSSRLMTAALGASVAHRVGAPLYLDIRDLFTDTMKDVLGSSPLRALLPAFRLVERRTLRRASRVNLVSAGFLPYARAIAPQHDYRVFTNGVDDEFLGFDADRRLAQPGKPPLVLYAGNIGEGQGLHLVLPEAARLAGPAARFRVVGDGGRRRHLEEALAASGVTNVELLPPVPRAVLHEHYREADILFLHLNDHVAFHKVLPSKLFEYAATGRKLLAGVAGHTADFLRAELPDAEGFAPCDSVGMHAALERLIAAPPPAGRQAFLEKFARKTIMQRMAHDILDMAGAD
jgi:glycosyltransferase involved in cell wall biosynthesis